MPFTLCRPVSPQMWQWHKWTTFTRARKAIFDLSGYEFDEKNFITAATNGDAAAVTAFLQAGINANAIDASVKRL